MKRILTVLVIFAAFSFANAQQEEIPTFNKKNEIKFNLPTAIFGSFPEITYERIISEDFTIGASVGFSVESESSYAEMDFMAIPYARWFFGGNTKAMQKYAAGFFIEANAAVVSGKKDVYYAEKPGGKEQKRYGDDYTGVGLGVAIGWKKVTKSNWVGEIFLGVGKQMTSHSEAYPRVGITIGKRF